MGMKYNNTSPYFLTPQNSYSLDIYVPRVIPVLDTDRKLILNKMYQFKPHLLAYDLYGDSRLWWVFAVRNKDILIDPIYNFVQGIEIYVTDKDALFSLLNV